MPHTVEVWPSFLQSLQQTLVDFLGVVEQELLLKDESSPVVELVSGFFMFWAKTKALSSSLAGSATGGVPVGVQGVL
jgi:hypothetical protein